ncbi:MAG: hypothetical protein AB7O74_03340 [Candidatus Nanopelagicales bacterium]
MHESRLELDDDGRVLDAPSEPVDLVADPPSQRRRLPRGTGPVVLVALVALAAWMSLRPEPAPALAAEVAAVGLVPAVDIDGPVVALYRVEPAAARTTVQVQGLVGPGVRASSAYADPAGRGLRVAVMPDCAALPPEGSAYGLGLTVTGAGGGTARGVVPAAGTVDWAAAIAERCWRRTTAAGLTLAGLTAEPDLARGIVRVSATLRNGTPNLVEVSALDVADVSTLEMAPASTLAAASRAAVQSRVTGRCGTAGSPPSLSWAVGPAGAPPQLTVTTPLSQEQQRTIARAMGVLCSSPPATSVAVVSAAPAPAAATATGERGAAVDLRLRVTSGAILVALGDDPSGATADARRAFSYAVLHGPVRDGEAVVRWQLSCEAPPAAALPLETRTQRLSFRSSVPLTGAVAQAAVREACVAG